MLALYVFSLVLGGGFLVVSLLGDVLGGGDVDTNLDVGMDGDVDLHVDTDMGFHTEGTLEAAHLESGADVHGAAAGTHAVKILSLRTVVYALFGFGAVGTALSLRGGGSGMGTFALALAGAVLTGGVVTSIFHYLQKTDSGAHASDLSFVGLSGTVTLPLSGTVPGTVVVERSQRRIALRALPHASSAQGVEGWKAVVIVDMQDGVARVAPVEEDLSLEP